MLDLALYHHFKVKHNLLFWLLGILLLVLELSDADLFETECMPKRLKQASRADENSNLLGRIEGKLHTTSIAKSSRH